MYNHKSSIHKAKVAALLLLSSFLMFSCEEDEVEMGCSGAPVITSITKPTDRTAVLKESNLDDWIIIQGSSFCHVEQITLNDVNVDLADAYITPSEITLRIPRKAPLVDSQKITVRTKAGTGQYTYTIIVPPIVITGTKNEYAAPGESFFLNGDNFDVYEFASKPGKVFFGTIEVPIDSASKNTLYLKVPAGATAGDEIKVVNASGIERVAPFRYKDSRNLLFDFENSTNQYVTDSPVPGGINGKYVRVNKQVNSWDVLEFAGGQVRLPAAAVSNPENYLLKFEVNTIMPFNSNRIRLMLDGNWGTENTYNWVSNPAFHTNGMWETMAIPLNSIINKPLDPGKETYKAEFIFHGNGVLTADMSFDNFRVVPKN
ncbi:glycan-binding surface protein [Pontibacter sp. 13R65]|uniref:glycan-binding surface protein n=1 Tax=Pontibacter sp. 13R65 TaxID=3127458 RepID=UPI00301CD0BD